MLDGKTVAVTGSTGGLGRALCRYLVDLHAELILLDRNETRSAEHERELRLRDPNARIRRITVDMEDMESVKRAAELLKCEPLDCLIHNAGAYSIPRRTASSGYINVFQINFVSPYYLTQELLPLLSERKGRVIAVGSIAHGYSKTDPADTDFSTRRAASKIYGNAKRYLMFSLYSAVQEYSDATLSVVHPGITFTNITAHYPRLIFALIKHPMKVIFMRNDKAALSILAGVFFDCREGEWIGPRWFRIWGLPGKKTLRGCSVAERDRICKNAVSIYQSLK